MDASLEELNRFLECPLCHGYLVDATTLGECLHSFCRSCIVLYLQHWEGDAEVKSSPSKQSQWPTYPQCPVCHIALHEVKPTSQLRADSSLQALVYKLVPQAFVSEMQLRRAFYLEHPAEASQLSPEKRGESNRALYNPSSPVGTSHGHEHQRARRPPAISLSLEYFLVSKQHFDPAKSSNEHVTGGNLYLLVEALTTLSLVRRLMLHKYSLVGGDLEPVFFFPKSDYTLSLDCTIQDLVIMSSYQRQSGPLRIHYAIVSRDKLPARSLVERREELMRRQRQSPTASDSSTIKKVTKEMRAKLSVSSRGLPTSSSATLLRRNSSKKNGRELSRLCVLPQKHLSKNTSDQTRNEEKDAKEVPPSKRVRSEAADVYDYTSEDNSNKNNNTSCSSSQLSSSSITSLRSTQDSQVKFKGLARRSSRIKANVAEETRKKSQKESDSGSSDKSSSSSEESSDVADDRDDPPYSVHKKLNITRRSTRRNPWTPRPAVVTPNPWN